MNIAKQKKIELRQKIHKERLQIDLKSWNNYDIAICKNAQSLLVGQNIVGFYSARPYEIDLSCLWDISWAQNIVTVLPKIIENKEIVFSSFSAYDQLIPGPYSILEPSSLKFLKSIDLLFIPGLAFDVQGSRLGYGKGYYDRFLIQHPEIIKVGICTKEKILDRIPSESHDIKMNYLVTEKEIIEI